MKTDMAGNAEDLAQLLASIPEFVLMVDPEGLVRYINHVEPGYDHDT